MLIGLAGEEVTSARCHYGTLPGGWLHSEHRALLPQPADNSTDVVFPIWQPFCGKCQLKPLLTPYLAVSQASPAVHLSLCRSSRHALRLLPACPSFNANSRALESIQVSRSDLLACTGGGR